MKYLADKSSGPPGGWRYTQPESGQFFRGVSYKQMLELIRQHRVGNKYDTGPGWEERFENDFCEQNQLVGTAWCPSDECREPRGERRLGLADVRRFLSSVASIVGSSDDAFVSQEVAEERATTCVGCINNANVAGCVGCNGIRNLIHKVKGSRTTEQDSRLKQCTVCGCDNSVKVWLDSSVVDNTGLVFPDHCWNRVPLVVEQAG
jgi:hypothetical protein